MTRPQNCAFALLAVTVFMLVLAQRVHAGESIDGRRVVQNTNAKRLLASEAALPMAAGNETTGVSDNEIVIGSCAPYSGPLKSRGPALAQGANAYFQYVNERGGIYHRKIRLITCDDQFNPEKAIECFNSCLKNKVFAGAFLIGSPEVTKYVRMGDVNRMPLIGFNVGTPILCELHPTAFNLQPCYPDEVRRMVSEIWQHGIRKIGVVYASDAFGAAIRHAVISELAKRGATPCVEASYAQPSADQVDAAYQQAKNARPEALFIAAATSAIKRVIDNRHADKLAAICLTVSPLDDALLEEGSHSDGFLITQVLPPLDENLPTIQLYRKLLKKSFPESQPHMHSLESFLNAMILVEGLKRAGPDLTRSKFVQALETIHDFDLGIGAKRTVTFTHDHHVGWTDAVLTLSIVRNGKIAPLTDLDWRQLVEKAKAG